MMTGKVQKLSDFNILRSENYRLRERAKMNEKTQETYQASIKEHRELAQREVFKLTRAALRCAEKNLRAAERDHDIAAQTKEKKS